MDKQTVLIVDDEKKVLELLKETIGELGNEYNVLTARNGKEALATFEKEKIDLVLLDINMPVMSGVQVLSELHNRKIWLPIIILTAYNVKGMEQKFLEFGIVDYLRKPLDLKKLKKRVEEILRNRTKKDSISGMSLAAILQVLEMEQRTGVLTIKTDKTNGRIFFKEGRVVDVEAEGLSAEEALGDLLDESTKHKEISIEYLNHRRTEKINKSLTEILLEASKLIDEDKTKKEEIKTDDQEAEIVEKVENAQLNELIESLKEELGDALLSTEIWELDKGEVSAGYNPRENVCDLFTQITFYINEALTTAEYPELGRYYILNLSGGKISVTVPIGGYFWGMLIDSKKTPLGFLLKVVLSKLIASFEEAISS
jgi:YesN/AraC family two-component response regulator